MGTKFAGEYIQYLFANPTALRKCSKCKIVWVDLAKTYKYWRKRVKPRRKQIKYWWNKMRYARARTCVICNCVFLRTIRCKEPYKLCAALSFLFSKPYIFAKIQINEYKLHKKWEENAMCIMKWLNKTYYCQTIIRTHVFDWILGIQ